MWRWADSKTTATTADKKKTTGKTKAAAKIARKFQIGTAETW